MRGRSEPRRPGDVTRRTGPASPEPVAGAETRQRGRDSGKCAVAPASHRLAEGRGQFGQDGGFQQKGPQLRLLAVQHLFGQKVKDVAICLGQVGDEGATLGGSVDAVEGSC